MTTRCKGSVLTMRDREILFFLWRWKVATTAALAAKFFPEANLQTAYRRLWRLESANFLSSHCDSRHQKFVWMLGGLGFRVISNSIPGLLDKGYRPESISHDLIASALHLGDWFLDSPPKVELVTDQELKHVDYHMLPKWIPSRGDHRPDGYWHFPVGERTATVALEVELNQKSQIEYLSVAEFYSLRPTIYRVLWLVTSQHIAESIEATLHKASLAKKSPHNFILFNVFRNRGWQTEIVRGPDQGKTVSQLLSGALPKVAQTFDTQAFLNIRKCPDKTKTPLILEKSDFSNRTPFSQVRYPVESSPS